MPTKKLLLEDRPLYAMQLKQQGYNCAQAVVVAFADLYGFTPEQAARMSAPFGGGIGKMRGPCGAALGLFMLMGLASGNTDATNQAAKQDNYKDVQKMAERFRQQCGSLLCTRMLGVPPVGPMEEVGYVPTAKDAKKQPCSETVRIAAQLFVDYLKERKQEGHAPYPTT